MGRAKRGSLRNSFYIGGMRRDRFPGGRMNLGDEARECGRKFSSHRQHWAICLHGGFINSVPPCNSDIIVTIQTLRK